MAKIDDLAREIAQLSTHLGWHRLIGGGGPSGDVRSLWVGSGSGGVLKNRSGRALKSFVKWRGRSVSRQKSRPAHHSHYKQRCHQDDERPLCATEPSNRSALSHALNYK
jgi:hypothetical protein